MNDLETYLFSALLLALFIIIFFFWKKSRKKSSGNDQRKYILEILDLARSQFETFNIKLPADSVARNGLSALLQDIDKDGLHMSVTDFVAEDWLAKPVDVYFRITRDSDPVSYVFHSVIRQIRPDYENSYILLSMPVHLQVEKKRHFIRVKPRKEDVRVIGVWPVKPGRHLPTSTDDMGSPLTHFKPGMDHEPVQMENISGSGLALRFPCDKDGKPPFEFPKGSQLICLVVYALGDSRPIAFWCTGEVMNTRVVDGKPPALVIGLEFTNWAVLEQGAGEIHWAHSSPSRGARPILRWVDDITKKDRQPAPQATAAQETPNESR